MREIHISSMRSFQQCRRLYEWSDRNHYNLTPNRPYPPFFFGQLAHYVLQEYYQQAIPMNISFSKFLRPYVASLGEIWIEERQMIAGQVKLCQLMLEHYRLWAKVYRDDFQDSNLDYLAVEQNFSVPLYDDVVFSGRWDGLARHKPTGKLYLIEYKTARAIDERLDTIRLDMQATGYAWAAQRILGEPIEGVIYTILRKAVPPMPALLQNGQLSQNRSKMTAEWFMRAIRRKYGPDAERAKRTIYNRFLQSLLDDGNDYFARAVVYKTPIQLQSFERKLLAISKEMLNPELEMYQEEAWHCRRCLFKDPCAAKDAGDDYKSMLADDYHYRQDAFLTVDSDVIPLVLSDD